MSTATMKPSESVQSNWVNNLWRPQSLTKFVMWALDSANIIDKKVTVNSIWTCISSRYKAAKPFYKAERYMHKADRPIRRICVDIRGTVRISQQAVLFERWRNNSFHVLRKHPSTDIRCITTTCCGHVRATGSYLYLKCNFYSASA